MADIDVTYDDMREAGDRLISEYELMDQKLDELQSYIDGLLAAGYTTSRSSGAFDDSYREFTQGAKKVLEGLQGMGNFLKTAAQAMEDTDTGLESSIRGG
ncbi:WXG100 family type VII secretion target [Streptomyces radicis]|uniref:WXG100 family type VII secretion target n=1 Tax=Streptomyces radicis TaxID=1750517 RepID=A0A3A9W3P9_9ACTN|nr:WXG100 family type VII secretion target [Streptomyces radicis]RKN07881.1 WXG100 family type VII secretion target [Streptomyces radicis]RKN20665.1 WXG100 family type VII secretion target [Streptomyces radicis]